MLQNFTPSENMSTEFSTPHTEATGEPPPISMFEFWPGSVFYTPIVLYWIAMGLRYGDFSIPSAANPRIETGGLCGESKSGILDMAGEIARPWIAPYVTLVLDEAGQCAHLARSLMELHGITFPVVVKPDLGCNGTGVKLVASPDALPNVLAEFPQGVKMIFQQLIDKPVEAGLFYIRNPGEPRGRITSITYKQVPSLTGNGVSTIAELIHQDPRTRLVPEVYLPRLGSRAETVPEMGETVPLVFTGNHCKGSIFLDGRDDVTGALTSRLDTILHDIPEFHFGRVDVKADSAEALRRGEGFQIIEINGVGSEATHIWDRRTTLREAYRAQFYHYRQAFRIGAENRRRGWKTCGALTMLRYWRKQKRMLASYPMND